MKGAHADKRDGNEAEIIAELERRGCRVIQQPRAAGFDLLVLWPGEAIWLVVVKDPKRDWKYTDGELALMTWCAENGNEYILLQEVLEIDIVIDKLEQARALQERLHGHDREPE